MTMKAIAVLANVATVAVAIWGTLLFMDRVGPDVSAAPGGGSSTGYRPPDQVDGPPMTEPAQVRAVLAQLGPKLRGGRIDSFRLAPERIDVIVRRAGQQTVVQFNRARQVSFEAQADSAGFTPKGVLPARIDPRAPSRILAAIARRRPGTSAAQLDYMVLIAASELPEWIVFLRGRPPLQWRSPLSGEGNVRVLGT